MAMSDHSVGSGGRLSVLSETALERLDAAALDVLATVGVSMPSPVAQAALMAAGAHVDGARVTLEPGLVRELVARAPRRLTLGGRVAPPLVTGGRSLLTTDGCCVEIYDLDTGEKRATVADDVVAITRVVDGMDQIDFVWPSVSAQDRPAATRGLHELYLTLANTGKHVQTVTVVEPQAAAVATEMARAVAGGEARLRAEPPISALLGTVTPLGNDAGTLETGLAFAAAGIPIGFVTMPMGGSTTPITMAGSLVVGMAEALSAVAMIQAAHPGAPVFICFIPSIMDLKTGDFTGGAPEDTIMGAAVGDVGHFYGLPTQCGVNSSGAKLPGWQSALDDVTTTLLSMAAGVDMLTGVGMVSGGRIFSFQEVVLAAEIAAQARAIMAGIALDGRPLDAAAGWAAGEPPSRERGAPDERATARVRELQRTHEPPALDEFLDAELRRLIGD